MRNHFAHRLVVCNHAYRRWCNTEADGFAVDLYLVPKLHALSDMGRLVVDGNTTFQDELLHFQPRPHARLGKHLVQFGGFWLGKQHPLGGGELGVGFILVELTRHHVGKLIAITLRRALGSMAAGLSWHLNSSALLMHFLHLHVRLGTVSAQLRHCHILLKRAFRRLALAGPARRSSLRCGQRRVTRHGVRILVRFIIHMSMSRGPSSAPLCVAPTTRSGASSISTSSTAGTCTPSSGTPAVSSLCGAP